MTKKRGRPKGAENKKHRQADHQDCLAIARLRLAEPSIKLWDAIFRVTGDGDGWKHQGARQRRLNRKYSAHEQHYLNLAKMADRPRRSGTASDITTVAREIEKTWRILQAQEDYVRSWRAITEMVRVATATLPRPSKNIW
jgi:glycine/D-amino acid oxidase-like deaminating enzyme